MDKIAELVEVVIHRTIALKVSCTFQYIDRSCLGVDWGKVLSELILKIHPV